MSTNTIGIIQRPLKIIAHISDYASYGYGDLAKEEK
jgi:hypothetical protein